MNEYNLGDIPFYFFTTGYYWKDGKILQDEELKKFEIDNKVNILTKEELLEFVKENEKNLPYRLNWF